MVNRARLRGIVSEGSKGDELMEAGIVVIDVPENTPPEEASRILNAPGDAYFLVQVLPGSGGHRAYLRRYKTAAKSKTETTSATVDDVTALSVVRANRDKPIRTIVDALAAAGIKRGRQWVSEQLTAICAEDGREDEAIAFLKEHPYYEPRDVVDELFGYHKIRRNAAWVRQMREELALSVR